MRLQQSALRKQSGWSEADSKVAEITLEEVEAGYLVGPLSVEQLEAQVGKNWVASRRFPIEQGNKIRPIDDFSEH